MFKEGDKVVCINDVDMFKCNKIYIIDKVLHFSRIQIKGYNRWILSSNNFIPLSEYRKEKIEKICSKLEIR